MLRPADIRHALLLISFTAPLCAAGEPFAIKVVDDQTGRGVPLVELQTVNHIRYVTDSNGIAAVDEPGLMGQTVFFHVSSHGYEFPADGFGMRGKRVKLEPGGSSEFKIKRTNIAERLYRITGQGIYRDSVLTAGEVPLKHPLLDGKVLGSDSVMNAVYQGKIYWFWGDTNRPEYPLGNFNVPGATSLLPDHGGLDPDRGVDLEYFVNDEGFAAETCPMPGPGPTWIDGLVTLQDPDGRERLFAHFVKIEPPMKVYGRGLAEFDPEQNKFQLLEKFPPESDVHPAGHPFFHTEDDTRYVYFAKPLAWLRVRATPDALLNTDEYEAYTCLSRDSNGDLSVDRGADGRLKFSWKSGGVPLTPNRFNELKKRKLLSDDENPFRLIDRDSGKTVRMHGASSIAWNDYRKKWTIISLEVFGTSVLGEIWYAEADRPEGPWSKAVKVVTHDGYSFYNPKQHPMLAKEGGKIIYFEGTYTATFSRNKFPTPRYDYNQIMYRLDLSDPRLKLE